MKVALEQARLGLGRTSPNPAVGAVIVHEDRILSRGYHRQAGMPHAEIEALRALENREAARGATLYVTLEPCSTHGRTPPCSDAILAAGIRRVVVGTIDPNPAHAGRGLLELQNAGIQVTTGVLEPECRALNLAFNHWIVHRRPWVIAKAGMSLDGRLTRPPGEGQWITHPDSRADAMQLRLRSDAILIGANTLRNDNPRLTLRLAPPVPHSPPPKQPWRIVVASKSSLPDSAHLFTDEHRDRTLVFREKALSEVLGELGKMDVTCVLIEGGMRVLGDALDQRLIDEVCFYIAPILCGGPVLAVGGEGIGSNVEAPEIVAPSYRRIGDDICCSGTLRYPRLSTSA